MIFDILPPKLKIQMVKIWNKMNEKDRSAFVDQVSLVIVLMGQNKKTYKLISNVLSKMLSDGSQNLSDFGIYMNDTKMSKEGKKAIEFIDDYRFKHDLPSIPHKPIPFK